MIKGFRFTNQLANAEVDARIHQEFLNKNDGIFYGMNLSKTTNSITISEGLCEIAGRPVAVINSETVTTGTDSLYCVLVLEIDLSKESTKDTFNQASFKLITSSSAYPTVTQQDINKYNGSNKIYQLEFARFRSGTSGITDFKDTRKFLNFKGIYEQVKDDALDIINKIDTELKNVKDGSKYLLKDGGEAEGEFKFLRGIDVYQLISDNIKKRNGAPALFKDMFATITGATSKQIANMTYPDGFTRTNCVPVSVLIKEKDATRWENGLVLRKIDDDFITIPYQLQMTNSGIGLQITIERNENGVVKEMDTSNEFDYKIVLMKTDGFISTTGIQ